MIDRKPPRRMPGAARDAEGRAGTVAADSLSNLWTFCGCQRSRGLRHPKLADFIGWAIRSATDIDTNLHAGKQ